MNWTYAKNRNKTTHKIQIQDQQKSEPIWESISLRPCPDISQKPQGSDQTLFVPRPDFYNKFVSLGYLFFSGINEAAWRFYSVLSTKSVSTQPLTKILMLSQCYSHCICFWASPCMALNMPKKLLWQELQKHQTRTFLIAHDTVPAD